MDEELAVWFTWISIICIIILISSAYFNQINTYNDTAIIIDKYDNEYMTLMPIPIGKGAMGVILQIHHDYFFNTNKGEIEISEEQYKVYNINDTIVIHINNETGKIVGIENDI